MLKVIVTQARLRRRNIESFSSGKHIINESHDDVITWKPFSILIQNFNEVSIGLRYGLTPSMRQIIT